MFYKCAASLIVLFIDDTDSTQSPASGTDNSTLLSKGSCSALVCVEGGGGGGGIIIIDILVCV